MNFNCLKNWSLATLVALQFLIVVPVCFASVEFKNKFDSMDIGAQYKVELIYHDHGLQKEGDEEQEPTSRLETSAANMFISGKVNKNTKFYFRTRLIDSEQEKLTQKESLVEGYVVQEISKSFHLALGKMRVRQGGFDNWNHDFHSHVQGHYVYSLPFEKFEQAVELRFHSFGDLVLQVLNDITKDNGGQWNENSHPTYIMGWRGQFGNIVPGLNIGAWDNQKSYFVDFGIDSRTGRFRLVLDYSYFSFANKGYENGDAKLMADVATSATLSLKYTVPNTISGFIYYSGFEKRQNQEFHGEDLEVNNTSDKLKTPHGEVTVVERSLWDDNGKIFAVGSEVEIFDHGFIPYWVIQQSSGDFLDENQTDKVTKTEVRIKIGVWGEI